MRAMPAAGPTPYGPRSIPLVCLSATECVLTDIIDTFGTRAYRLVFDSDSSGPLHVPPPASAPVASVVAPPPCAGNVTRGCNAVFNPSFEDLRGMDVPDVREALLIVVIDLLPVRLIDSHIAVLCANCVCAHI